MELLDYLHTHFKTRKALSLNLLFQAENMLFMDPAVAFQVNGPGEAKEADIGIAGGVGVGLLIKGGEIVKKVPEDQLLDTLREELMNWDSNKTQK